MGPYFFGHKPADTITKVNRPYKRAVTGVSIVPRILKWIFLVPVCTFTLQILIYSNSEQDFFFFFFFLCFLIIVSLQWSKTREGVWVIPVLSGNCFLLLDQTMRLRIGSLSTLAEGGKNNHNCLPVETTHTSCEKVLRTWTWWLSKGSY